MKNRIMRIFLGSVMGVVFLVGSTLAMPPGEGPGRPGGPRGGDDTRLIESLDLTSEQIVLLKKDKIVKRKKSIKLRAELETLQIDMAEVSMANNPDLQKVDKIANAMGNIRGQMIALRVRSVIYLRSILTDEQKKKMDARGLQFDNMGGKHGHKSHEKKRR
jgi:periplasmic protein CpxP/Spy